MLVYLNSPYDWALFFLLKSNHGVLFSFGSSYMFNIDVFQFVALIVHLHSHASKLYFPWQAGRRRCRSSSERRAATWMGRELVRIISSDKPTRRQRQDGLRLFRFDSPSSLCLFLYRSLSQLSRFSPFVSWMRALAVGNGGGVMWAKEGVRPWRIRGLLKLEQQPVLVGWGCQFNSSDLLISVLSCRLPCSFPTCPTNRWWSPLLLTQV